MKLAIINYFYASVCTHTIILYTYEGCLLHFGIREQKQILIIENSFIVFQNIPH